MAVYKDKWDGYDSKTWRVACYYYTWDGQHKKHEKRGFKTKREAVEYEKNYLLKKKNDINMSFGTFVDRYLEDIRPRIKESTYEMKVNVINTHIRKYFKMFSVSEITAVQIIQWQNQLLTTVDANGRRYSLTYLRTIQNQLNAIFNHAVRYYGLEKSPCSVIQKIGQKKPEKEMQFWTLEEYKRFSEVMKDKPISYYAFQVLFWTGIRVGELIALTREDFDLEKQKLTINKTVHQSKGKITITPPKTSKSNRIIDLPEFLCLEMEEYFDSIYRLDARSRVFEITKSFLHHELNRGCKKTGIKRIRLHDLRHSSTALLIELGFSTLAIAERLGHESVHVTEQYSHLYPSVQQKMANCLDEINKAQRI